MSNKDGEKRAFICVLAVVGALAITKSELTGDAGLSEGIIRWLLFSLACGLVVNDQEGRPFGVIFFSAIAATLVMISVITFKFYLGKVIRLSGVEIGLNENVYLYLEIITVLAIATIAAIIICSYARGFTLTMLNGLLKIELEKAKRIESLLNKIVSILTISLFIIFAIL